MKAGFHSLGFTLAISAFTLWGLFPLYWKQLASIDSLNLMCQRVIWGAICFFLILCVQKQLKDVFAIFKNKKSFLVLSLTALLILANWFLFVWAINHGHLVEVSLGYYLNPLLNVLLGVLFLKERLSPIRWLSVFLAAIGVFALALNGVNALWISLVLASTFALYGLLRKVWPIPGLSGNAFEMFILFFPILFFWQGNLDGLNHFKSQELSIQLLMIAAGPVTILPLFLYNLAAKKLPYSTIGIIQYLAPSLQLLIGVLVYNEDFGGHKLISFTLIWLSLALFSFGDRLLSKSNLSS